MSCKKYDPRCLVCDAQACLECADPLLNSVRRSGARALDAPLPFDELTREFSFTFSYGSQHPRVFDEAEAFFLMPSTSTSFLNGSSKTCSQGVNGDATWSCKPFAISHRVCGHNGVFSFGSPVYAIAESAKSITLTVQRSGGGLGSAAVGYDIQYLTASASDVSPTAFYTSSQLLVFDEGVVELAFQLTIHDDHVVEPDETFRVTLRNPEFETTASLGNQRQALVTILDDDAAFIDAGLSFVVNADSTLKQGGQAGTDLVFTIQSILGNGAVKTGALAGGGNFLMESYMADIEDDLDEDASFEVYRSKQLGKFVDNGDSTYTCTWQRKHAGTFTVAVYLLYPGGLRGDYYDDAWLGDNGLISPAITRVDRQLNFTWGTGPLFPGASDYVSVRWSGRIKPKSTEDVTFYVAADDHARLWIGDFLLIDKWDDASTASGQASATITLDASLYYAIVLDYRELNGNAQVSLYWSSASLAQEIIPAASLFSIQHISGSPFQNVTIAPVNTANVHTSTIQGVLSSIAGSPHSVEIFPVDVYGNPRRVQNDSTDLFEARMTLTIDQSLGGIGSRQNDALIVWNPVREAFKVSFTPLLSGIYDFDVWINTVKLDGSPFTMVVKPGVMHATRSVISGDGLLANRVAGIATTLLLEVRDVNNNRIYTSESPSTLLSIRAFHTTQLSAIETGSVADNGDGTYTLTYTPRIAGSYNVRVLRNGGADVNNSPYLVSVVPNVPMGTTSSAAGTGLTSAETNVQALFQVITRDLHSNLVIQGGASFQVTVEHPVKGIVAGSCSDLLTGVYLCVYTAHFVGASKLNVVLTYNGMSLPISGSPFALNVVAGPALGSFSLAQGPGLVSTIAGVSASFTVLVRDAFGNEKRNDGQESVTAVFRGPAPTATTTVVPVESTELAVVFAGDDKFQINYTLQNKGTYTIQVQVNGVDVVASPFTIYTYPAAASPVTTSLDLIAPLTTATAPVQYVAGALITTLVTTRDVFGNLLETGGYSFQLNDQVHGFQANPVVDAGDGSYSLLLRPLQAGIFPFEPKILLTGGLNGTYFPTPDLAGESILKRQDPVIELDFGVTPPLEADAMETFSVRWEGFLLPAYSEVYAFDAEMLGGASLSVNNVPLLTDLWPEASITQSKQPSQVYLVANQFVSIELNFSKPRAIPNGKIRLFWQSLSRKREVIPTNRLFASRGIVNNVPRLEILPASSDPPSFTAEFDPQAVLISSEASASSSPIIRATAGTTFSFQVIARDQFANKRLKGGDTVHVLFPQLADAVNPSPITIVDLNNAVYEVSFTPIQSGTFSMVVAATDPSVTGYEALDREALALFLRPYYTHQSPFTFIVEPNGPLSTTSTSTGLGYFQATAGIEASFVIQLRDLHSNPVSSVLKTATDFKTPLPRVQLRLGGVLTGANTVEASLTRSQDGTFKATYTATHSGLYQVMLSCDSGLTFTSKSSTLRVFPNIASALTSTITSGMGLGPQIQTSKLVTYSVSLRDFYSNSMEIGGDDLVVVLRGPGIVYPASITDLATANYVVAYQVSQPGSYEIQTWLASHYHGLLGSYFPTTRFSSAVATVAAAQAIDANVNFDWQANETMRNYPRIRWTGFLKPKYTEVYTLHLKVRPFGAVYIDQVPVIDALNSPLATEISELTGQVDLVGGRLHAITVEYRSPSAREVFGFVSLLWESDRQRLEVVPTTAFFPGAQEIHPRYTVVAV